MASVRSTRSGNFELRVRNKLLPKDLYLTFNDEAKARDYGSQLEALLAQGIVPHGLIEEAQQPSPRLRDIVRAWQQHGSLSSTDSDVLELVLEDAAGLQLNELTYTWCEQWVRDMKLKANLAPSTIRKRIGALARAIDWHMRKTPDQMVANPLRMLPRGSASYSAKDAVDAAAAGGRARLDTVRDRRLKPGEHERILRALDGHKRPDRERPLPVDHDLRDLYLLILHTGLRLREAYTLRSNQVHGNTLRVRCSKQWHGREAWRNVPMVLDIREMMAARATRTAPDGLIFPFWDGDPSSLEKASARLSRRFGLLFGYAQCEGLTEHDLRHEATCRWYEMRRPDGAWLFREAEIGKIMGWAPGSSMGNRYASFRAEDLADRLG